MPSRTTHVASPMTALAPHLRAEQRKLLTTRLLPGHAAAAFALGVLGVLASLGQPSWDASAPAHLQQFMVVAALGRIPLVLLGVRLAVDEYRHGTAAMTLATACDRRHVVLAKALVGAAAGAAVGLAAQAVTFGVATIGFAAKGHQLGFDGRLPLLLAGAAVAGAAWTAIGTAIGELAREPIAPTVGTVLWFLLLEELLASRLGDLGPLLPGAQGYVLFLLGEAGPAARAGLGLLAWATLAAGLAAVSIRRRDLA